MAGQNFDADPATIMITRLDASIIPDRVEGIIRGIAISIESTVEYPGPFVLEMALPEGDGIPLVWHEMDGGEVRISGGVWDAENRTITLAIDNFSLLESLMAGCDAIHVCRIDDYIGGLADDIFDSITGRTDPPQPCDKVAGNWAALRGNLEPVHECINERPAIDDRNQVEVLIKSNRQYLQLVRVPANARDVQVEVLGADASRFLAELNSLVAPVSPNSYVLYNGGDISYSLAQPILDRQHELLAHQTVELDLLSFAKNILLGELEKLGIPEFIKAVVLFAQCMMVSDAGGIAREIFECIGVELKRLLASEAVSATVKRLLKNASEAALELGTKMASSAITTLVSAFDFVKDRLDPGEAALNLSGYSSAPIEDLLRNQAYVSLAEATGEIPTLLLVDTSGSMGETVDGRVKLDAVKDSIDQILTDVSSDRLIGLRTFPYAHGRDCNAGELWVPLSDRVSDVRDRVASLEAGGNTPTAEALNAAFGDIIDSGILDAKILLFSDGMSNCNPPCDVARGIAAVGLNVEVDTGSFRPTSEGSRELACIAGETGGDSFNIEDLKEVDEFFRANTLPDLEVTLHGPPVVTPSTDASSSPLQIEATVQNHSNVAAKNVRVVLEVGSEESLARYPVAVGNVAPKTTTTAQWDLNPGFDQIGAAVPFEVAVTADNTQQEASDLGSVVVENPNVPAAAGGILGVGQVVLMGDQLLSGVGSSTRAVSGDCRRSREIGLLVVFGQGAERSVACANAGISQLSVPDGVRGVDSQIDQLADILEGPSAVNAVIVSIGATDFGLVELANACVLSATSCTSQVSGLPTEVWFGQSIAIEGPRRDAAIVDLVRSLAEVDRTLNASLDEARRTPILLLAQPRALPFVHGACFQRWLGDGAPLLTQSELNLYHALITATNETLEAATDAAQQLGLPAFFVHTTESAYLPDHTACSSQPYVRSLEPLVEANPDALAILADQGSAGLNLSDVEKIDDGVIAAMSEEFLVPNSYGEQALANAVLRWSQTDEAQDAEEMLEDRFVRRVPQIAPSGSTPTIEGVRPLTPDQVLTVESGEAWTAEASGFQPGTLVTAAIRPSGRVLASAVADEDGTASLFVAPPRGIVTPNAEIVASGQGPAGEHVAVVQSIEILPPLRPIAAIVHPTAALLLLMASLMAWRAALRRRVAEHQSSEAIESSGGEESARTATQD